MLTVSIDLSHVDRAAEMWRRFPERLQKRLRGAMVTSLVETEKQIKDRIPGRSGTLRRKFSADPSPTPAGSSAGWIGHLGVHLPYAAYQEWGFHGTENVRAHTRRSAFGRETRPFQVPAYTRNVNYAGRPYARPGITAAAPKIGTIHKDAVADEIGRALGGHWWIGSS